MKDRAKRLIKNSLIILLLGVLYLLLWRFGLDLKCPAHELFGLLCPGCGISRMLVSLVRLDLRAAAFYNLAGLLLLPLWIAVGISYYYEYIKHGTKTFKSWYRAAIIITIAVLAIYGVLRNVTDMGLSPSDDIEFFKHNILGGT